MTVPNELQRQIFPELDSEFEKVSELSRKWWASEATVERRQRQTTKVFDPYGGPLAFLKLLRYLRIVLLQDAPFLLQLYPNHPVFQSHIFKSSTFLNYARDTLERFTEIRQPLAFNIEAVLPEVAAQLVQLATQQRTAFEHQERFSQGKFDQNKQWQVLAFQEVKHRQDGLYEGLQNITTALGGLIEAIGQANGSVAEAVRAARSNLRPIQPQSPPVNVSTDRFQTAISDEQLHGVAPYEYKMCRSAGSIEALWNEWDTGLDGGPAVRDIYLQHGGRFVRQDKNWFLRRHKFVIQPIEKRVAAGEDLRAVIADIQRQLSSCRPATMNAFLERKADELAVAENRVRKPRLKPY